MKLLLVDDHAMFCDGMSLLLKKLDPAIDVITAGNFNKARDVLENIEIDLILLDLNLPGISGLEALEILRNDLPNTPVVVLSAESDVDIIRHTVSKGAMGFIPKSYSSTIFFEVLQRIIIDHGVFLPCIASQREPLAMNPGVNPTSIGLSRRQVDVLYCLLQGKTNKRIASMLGIEEVTVKAHVSGVLRILNVMNRTEAVVAANSLGLVFNSSRSVYA